MDEIVKKFGRTVHDMKGKRIKSNVKYGEIYLLKNKEDGLFYRYICIEGFLNETVHNRYIDLESFEWKYVGIGRYGCCVGISKEPYIIAKESKKMTNFDRIKNMTVEEFMHFTNIMSIPCHDCVARKLCDKLERGNNLPVNRDGSYGCENIIKQWLNSEVKEKEYYIKINMPIDISHLKIQIGDKVNLMVYKTTYGEFEISEIDNRFVTYKVDKDTADKFTRMIEEELYDRRIYSVEYR